MTLTSAMAQRVLLLDGALGTEFYRRGVFINRCYDELVLSQPELVRAVHQDYVDAGADLITTNTFGANRVRLQAFGLEDRIEEIVLGACSLAKSAAKDRAFVLGSVGPTGANLAPSGRLSPGMAYQAFREQIQLLAQGGVDGLLLETFTTLSELWHAVRAAKDAAPELPIFACLSFKSNQSGETLLGEDPEEAARTMDTWGVAALGVNCSTGPAVVLDVIERMERVTELPLIAYPNAGIPQMVDGRRLYLASPEYMAEFARRFVTKGAQIVGGCCGTTPAMVREMRSFVRSVSPARSVLKAPLPAKKDQVPTPEPVPIAERSTFAEKLQAGKFCISVELDPPRGLDPSRSLDGAAFLQKAGIDVINIADGPRATARMGPAAMAQLARERCGVESVVHVCCRDRNLLGLQMDLLSYNALGIRNILAVTGDPPKMGNYPDATAVFDIDSIGLIHFIQNLNRGMDLSGRPIGGQTRFHVGAGCNPAHPELQREVDRFGQKIEAGAEYFFSQPLYDPEVLERFLEMTAAFPTVPFLVGILPLASSKNAEFLHNEVPGMQVPESIRRRLREAPTRAEQREIGIQVARQTLALAHRHPRVNGAYIYPPFGSYQAVLDVMDVLPPNESAVD
ncbi:MAG: methionine synthase I (cobalamin-dependent)/5,10-methylenetetrahydrofolate reductase [Cognaticolwellia sp.]